MGHPGKMPKGMGKKPENMGGHPTTKDKQMPQMGKPMGGKAMQGMPKKGMAGMAAMMKDKKKSYSKEEKRLCFCGKRTGTNAQKHSKIQAIPSY